MQDWNVVYYRQRFRTGMHFHRTGYEGYSYNRRKVKYFFYRESMELCTGDFETEIKHTAEEKNMDLNRKNVRKIRGLIIFTAIVCLAVLKFDVVLTGILFVIGIAKPFLIGRQLPCIESAHAGD